MYSIFVCCEHCIRHLLCFPLDEVGFDSLAVGDHQVRQEESGFAQEGVFGEVFLLLSVRVVVHTNSYLVAFSCKNRLNNQTAQVGCKKNGIKKIAPLELLQRGNPR